MQVFDVMFNSQHTVVENLDIFAKAGRAVAHDEIVPFTVEDGQLIVNNERSDFDGTLVIEFVKVITPTYRWYLCPSGCGFLGVSVH